MQLRFNTHYRWDLPRKKFQILLCISHLEAHLWQILTSSWEEVCGAASTNSCLLPCRDLTQSSVQVMEQRTGEEPTGCHGLCCLHGAPVWVRRIFWGWTQDGWWHRDKQGHIRKAGSWQRDGKSASHLLHSAITPSSPAHFPALLAPMHGHAQLLNPICVWVNLFHLWSPKLIVDDTPLLIITVVFPAPWISFGFRASGS